MRPFFSPAKLNLFLAIKAKRPDGYHELESLFQAISLGDTLWIEEGPQDKEDQLTCTDPSLPVDSSNLILKAVKAVKDYLKAKDCLDINFSVRLHLEKKIPMQAGLGGGSSNAATTLYALKELFNLPLSMQELMQIGATIGSDVPFFLSSGTALCQGRGEIIEDLKPLPHLTQQLWIIKPPFGLSTPAVYSQLNLQSCFKGDCRQVLAAFYRGDFACFNDLEAPAFKIEPALKELKKSLSDQGYKPLLMSGSGSSFFCFGSSEPLKLSHLSNFSNLSSSLASSTIYPATFIQREEGGWYAKG